MGIENHHCFHKHNFFSVKRNGNGAFLHLQFSSSFCTAFIRLSGIK